MGIQSLQDFIEARCQKACRPVDLLKMARGFAAQRRGRGCLSLVVDAESCLDRLYGGYYPDWSCGGQWNRMVEFLNTLMQACHTANMELVVFFNGALESHKLADWYEQQADQKQRIFQVLKHLNNKATPPPKIWWVPPACLSSCLRMALRQLGVTVACSTDDHYQEVIAYCRENNFFGILAQDAEYAIFDPPHYFSSHNLKLTYKGALETQEYVLDEVARIVDLHPKRFTVLAALLGNHLLPESDLKTFYQMVLSLGPTEDHKKVKKEDLIQAVIDFVRRLETVDNSESVAQAVFKNYTHDQQDKMARFKESVQYYINGTQEGFLKYRPRMHVGFPLRQPGSYPGLHKDSHHAPAAAHLPNDNDDDSTQEGSAIKPDEVYTKAESGYGMGTDATPDIKIEGGASDLQEKMQQLSINGQGPMEDPAKLASSSSSSGSSPGRFVQDGDWAAKLRAAQEQKRASGKGASEWRQKIPHDVMRIASERHQKGLMSPAIYQVLTQGEVKLPVTLEEDRIYELPTAVELYRPIRQMVYGILFDITKKRLAYKTAMENNQKEQAEKIETELYIKEWYLPRGDIKPFGENVQADPLNWKVPGIRRLWLGQATEDKNCRLRAFFTCMKSNNPLMMNTSYVPQHLIILCCVLRYMLMYRKQPVLRKHELDAFLAAAVSPLLHDVSTMLDMKLPMITTRGVQLGALFMRGVEAAIFGNDACGSPIPWTICCPWLFFDGKLFHFKLLKANNQTPLIDICDGHIEQVMRVERMRQAILEGLNMDEHYIFAKPPLPMMSPQYRGYPPPPDMNFRPAGAPPPQHGPQGHGQHMGRGRGILGRSPVDGRGGQLQIAGVVVGNWGPNTQSQGRGMGRGTHVAPHVTSVGPRHRGGMTRGVLASRAHRGRGVLRQRYHVPAQRYYGMPYKQPPKAKRRGTNNVGLKGRKPEGRGRGLTIENGDSDDHLAAGDDVTQGDPEIGQFQDVEVTGGPDGAVIDAVNQGFNGSAPQSDIQLDGGPPIGTFE